MGWISYFIARSASDRVAELEDRFILLEQEVKDLKRKMERHGTQ